MTSEQKNALLDRIRHIPIVETLRFHFDDFGDGHCRMSMPRSTDHDGIYQSLHGGLLMTLADSAACFAIMTRTGPEEVLTTTDMSIRFLAPCLTDPTATARVIKLGRTMCPVAVDIHDTDGTHIAVAQVNYIRLNRMPPRP